MPRLIASWKPTAHRWPVTLRPRSCAARIAASSSSRRRDSYALNDVAPWSAHAATCSCGALRVGRLRTRVEVGRRYVDCRSGLAAGVDEALDAEITREVERAGGADGRHAARQVEHGEAGRRPNGLVRPHLVEQVVVHAHEPWEHRAPGEIHDARAGRHGHLPSRADGGDALALDDDRVVVSGGPTRAVDDAHMRECDDRRLERQELSDPDAATAGGGTERQENADERPDQPGGVHVSIQHFRILAQRTTTHGRDPEPACRAVREHDPGVDEHEEKDREQRISRDGRPALIRSRIAPPEECIEHPQRDERVVDVETAAPVESRERRGLARGVLERGVLTPAVDVVEDRQAVDDEQGGACRPERPRRLAARWLPPAEPFRRRPRNRSGGNRSTDRKCRPRHAPPGVLARTIVTEPRVAAAPG